MFVLFTFKINNKQKTKNKKNKKQKTKNKTKNKKQKTNNKKQITKNNSVWQFEIRRHIIKNGSSKFQRVYR